MQNFLSRFIVVALVGTAMVYFGAPALQEALHATPAARPDGQAAVTMLKDQLGFFFVSNEQPFEEEPPSSPGVAPPDAPPDTPPGTPATSREAPAGSPPPASDGARWAVVWQPESRAYSRDGKYIGRLNPGAFLEIIADAASGGKPFHVARVLEGAGKGQEVVVQASCVTTVPGHWDQAPATIRQLHVDRARILAEMDRIRNSSLREENPHAAEYAAARDAYRKFWTRVKELQAKRDTGSGDHMQYSDELRMMKGEDIRVGKAFESAKQKYDEWNSRNPVSARTNPKLAALSAQLTAIEQNLGAAPDRAVE